jgi:hypothetical protein
MLLRNSPVQQLFSTYKHLTSTYENKFGTDKIKADKYCN